MRTEALVTFALTLAACSSSAADAARVRALVEPHLEGFAEYDRWARRLALGDAAFRSEEALAEAAFAPLRGDATVVAAWIEREGPDAHTLVYPEGAPPRPASGWVRVRTETLGEIEAQTATLRAGDANERDCVVLRRSAPAPRGATLHVTVAFVPSS
jgi:hypothetical protein